MDSGAGQGLGKTTAVAGGCQFHARLGHQSVGNVAGGHVRCGRDRPGIGLGAGDGHEHDAGFPPRLAVATGRQGFSATPGSIPRPL